jgi:hypothetical protein
VESLREGAKPRVLSAEKTTGAGCAKPDTSQFAQQSIDAHLTVRGGSCRGSTMPNIIKAELAIDRASHSG